MSYIPSDTYKFFEGHSKKYFNQKVKPDKFIFNLGIKLGWLRHSIPQEKWKTFL